MLCKQNKRKKKKLYANSPNANSERGVRNPGSYTYKWNDKFYVNPVPGKCYFSSNIRMGKNMLRNQFWNIFFFRMEINSCLPQRFCIYIGSKRKFQLGICICCEYDDIYIDGSYTYQLLTVRFVKEGNYGSRWNHKISTIN